jgi:hypothetical protein
MNKSRKKNTRSWSQWFQKKTPTMEEQLKLATQVRFFNLERTIWQ